MPPVTWSIRPPATSRPAAADAVGDVNNALDSAEDSAEAKADKAAKDAKKVLNDATDNNPKT